MQAWYVVNSAQGREHHALKELQAIELQAFLPTYAKKRVHNHRIETVFRPLFPRYLFVRFDSAIPGWGNIKRDCRSIYSILTDAARNPIPLPDPIMDAIMARTDPTEAVQADPEYTLQQRVRVKDGLLQGVEGLFVGSEKNRTIALMEILGRRVKVPMPMIEAA